MEFSQWQRTDLKEVKMKGILMGVIAGFCSFAIFAEMNDVQSRFLFCREIWQTNALQCVKSARGIIGSSLSDANDNSVFGRWFVEFLDYPDVTDTNRLEKVLFAKERAIFDFASLPGVVDNTNVWFAAADFLGRLREVKAPCRIDGSTRVVTGYINDVAICANTNSLLDFKAYRRVHPGADFRSWKKMVALRRSREQAIASAERVTLRVLGEFYWRWGARGLSPEELCVCRSNIVMRARLTREEEDEVFSGVRYNNLPVPSLRGRRTK